MKRSIYRIIFVLSVMLMCLGPVRPALAEVAAASLLISEVQTGGLTSTGAEDGRLEFVELYNPHDTPYLLTGM